LNDFRTTFTRVEQHQELETHIVTDVKLEFGQFSRELAKGVGQRGHPEQAEAQQVELLSVGQGGLVRQVVVHALVHVVQHQHVRPRVLQQLHLVVHLDNNKKYTISKISQKFKCKNLKNLSGVQHFFLML